MTQQRLNKVLRIDSSARRGASVTRAIGDEVLRRLQGHFADIQISWLDLADGMPRIDGNWVTANFSPQEERSDAQHERLAASDAAVAALAAADAVVITAPVYNFSVPSVLNAWIDHVCRAGLTFRYTEQGPQGLLADRPVYLVMASGGVPLGSPLDFASGYLRQVLRFIGIEDVRLIGAEGVATDAAAARRVALETLNEWLPEPTGLAA